jgi:hypothetical protein
MAVAQPVKTMQELYTFLKRMHLSVIGAKAI